MKLLNKNQEALNRPCPYCGAKPGERCKVIDGNTYTNGTEPYDAWGQPLIHSKRTSEKLNGRTVGQSRS